MISRILVPLDGSRLSDSILVHVRKLLARQKAEVTLLRVLPETGAPDRTFMDEGATPREHMERLAGEIARLGIEAKYRFASGDPAVGILNAAEDLHPSLIAMTTHGRSGLNRWVRGSVAERVLRRSRHPLLLSHPGGEPREAPAERDFRRILVPLDGTDVSARILPLVQDLAVLYGSEVVLLHVVMVLPVSAESTSSIISLSPEGAVALLEPSRQKLASAGIPVRIRTDYGVEASGILRAAEEQKADLLAMTTHGRCGLSRWVFGSVAEKVLRHCAAPILVMRTAGREEGRAGAEGGAEGKPLSDEEPEPAIHPIPVR